MLLLYCDEHLDFLCVMWMMLKKHYAALYVGGQHPSAALLQKKPIDTFSECSDCGKEPALYPMKKTLQQTQLNCFFSFLYVFTIPMSEKQIGVATKQCLRSTL